jgi:peptide-methionine (R)-S-oxide reductase
VRHRSFKEMYMKDWILIIIATMSWYGCYSQTEKNSTMDSTKKHNPVYSNTDSSKVALPDEEWKKILSPEVYYIARQKGTERPWTSKFETSKEIGTYYCAVCGNPLFKSDTKFESGCGWPSFYQPISKSSIIYLPDNTHGMNRTEVECGRCKSHLGHVFEDGPPPTGLRYCINGVVLDFQKAKEAEKNYNSGQPKPGEGS